MSIKYIKNNSYKNLFFLFSFLEYLNRETEHFSLNKIAIFFQLKSFVDKKISIATHSTKLMILILLNRILQYFINFI